MTKKTTKARPGKGDSRQKGRQQGSQTRGEAAKSNNQQFYRHPGQGMRGKEGGLREEEREPGQETTGSDPRKHTRPEQER